MNVVNRSQSTVKLGKIAWEVLKFPGIFWDFLGICEILWDFLWLAGSGWERVGGKVPIVYRLVISFTPAKRKLLTWRHWNKNSPH